jgi:hypothetical protein
MTQKQSKRARLFAEVQAQGFDQSVISGSGVRVRCSQCEALVINGVATHETRCPNARHECRGCMTAVPRGVRYCEDCS